MKICIYEHGIKPETIKKEKKTCLQFCHLTFSQFVQRIPVLFNIHGWCRFPSLSNLAPLIFRLTLDRLWILFGINAFRILLKENFCCTPMKHRCATFLVSYSLLPTQTVKKEGQDSKFYINAKKTLKLQALSHMKFIQKLQSLN